MIRALILACLALALSGCGVVGYDHPFAMTSVRSFHQPHYDPGLSGAVRDVVENRQ